MTPSLLLFHVIIITLVLRPNTLESAIKKYLCTRSISAFNNLAFDVQDKLRLVNWASELR